LLRAILGQNRRARVSVSSPLFFLVTNLIALMSPDNELTRVTDAQRERMLEGLLEGFIGAPFGGLGLLFFDTNRLWPSRIPLLKQLLPDARMICCVRNPAWVLDSYERIYRKNPLRGQRLFQGREALSVYARAEALMDVRQGLVGTAWRALREAWYMERDRLILLPYDELTRDPPAALARVYRELGEPDDEVQRHDFNDVRLEPALYREYDDRCGLPGLHAVRGEVKAEQREPILPPDLFEKYSALEFWD
jgi:sulfotransferase